MRFVDIFESVTFGKPSPQDPAIQALIDASTQDPHLGDIATKKKLKDMVVFYYNDVPAGFAIPRRESDSYYRTGPIFVLPEYRNKGLAKQFVANFFQNKKGRAYIADTNVASQQLFTAAGFTRTDKSVVDDGEQLYQYIKEQ